MEKARWCLIWGCGHYSWPLRLRTECLSSTDLHRAREKQPASFIVLCKDATGESMGRGGDNVQVTVIPKDKKDRFVSCTQASWTWKSKVLCSHGAVTAVVPAYLPMMALKSAIGPRGPDAIPCVGFRLVFDSLPKVSSAPADCLYSKLWIDCRTFCVRLNGALLKVQPHVYCLCWERSYKQSLQDWRMEEGGRRAGGTTGAD